VLPAPVPDHRPRRRRRTARVLLLDRDDAVFLWHDSDPGADGRPGFWITAGGGVDAGESDESAAVREVDEETGIRLRAEDLVGPLAERVVVHGYSDLVVIQQEVFFAARVDRRVPDQAGHTEDERASIQGHRWWRVDELAGTDELVLPAGLDGLVRTAAVALADMRAPDVLVPLPSVQESTVDAGGADEGAGPQAADVAAPTAGPVT
jgi:8-oxo-dGTP pyrophosphatase MutT (NUDIX family)